MDNVVKYFNTIEGTLKRTRFLAVAALACTAVISLGSVFIAAREIGAARREVYVIEDGTALQARAADGMVEKDLEVKDHLTRFHELMFNLSPSAESIRRNIDRALVMSDRSAYDYWQDLSEKGFYQRIVSANISQEIVLDSVAVDVGAYPYEAKAFGKLYLMRESNITLYQFESQCRMVDVSRSETNPHGLMIERFTVTRNENIGTKKRK